ncbi:Fc.00g012360.m01.CDS01 [Cosmosporella sp. VM-42]
MESYMPTGTPCLSAPILLLGDRVKREQPRGAITIDIRSPSPPQRSNKLSRERLFMALEHRDAVERAPRCIRGADDLDEFELKRCFEILHACGIATDTEVTLKTTRETIEPFLNAVFRDWTGNTREELIKPVMDFVVRDFEAVAHICEQPSHHRSGDECKESRTCRGLVYAHATYRSKPAKLELGFVMIHADNPFLPSNDEDPQFCCPLGRDDIRWLDDNRSGLLRYYLTKACIAKVHKHNKHLAVWQTRKLIQGWTKGSMSMGDDAVVLDFFKMEALDRVLAIMGPLRDESVGDV